MSAAAHGSPTAANIGAFLLLPTLLLDHFGVLTIQITPLFRPNFVFAIAGFFLIQLAYYWLLFLAFRLVLHLILNARAQS